MASFIANGWQRLRDGLTQAQSQDLITTNPQVASLCGHVVLLGLTGRALSSVGIVATVALSVLFAPFMGTATLAGMAIKIWFLSNLYRVSENLMKLATNPAQVIGNNPENPQQLVTELRQHQDAIKTALKADTYYFGVGVDIFVDGALFLATMNVFPRVEQNQLPR